MKKLFVLLFIICCFALVSCKKNNEKTLEAYAMYQEAISGANYLSALKPVKYLSNTEDDYDPSNVIARLESYSNQNIVVKDLEVDLEGYSSKQSVTVNKEEYFIYLKEISKDVELEEDDDEVEEEIKTVYEGKVVSSNMQYEFKAVEKIEKESNSLKDEVESEFTMYMQYSDNKTLKIVQEKEVEEDEYEEEFSYIMYTNNQKQTLFSIERSIEDGVEEIRLVENGQVIKAEFYTKNNKSYCEIYDNGKKYYFEIFINSEGIKEYIKVDKKLFDDLDD